MYYLTAEAAFDSAHFLFGYEGKCANIHGHRWRIVATVKGKTLQDGGQEDGMLLDFGTLKKALRDLAEGLDHRLLIEKNTLRLETMDALEAEGFLIEVFPFRPTAENFARFLYEALAAEGFPLASMAVYETPENCALYEGGAP